MLPDEAKAQLRLARSPRIGPVTFAQLIRRFGTATAVLEALPDLARRGGGQAPALASAQEIEAEIQAVIRCGGRFLFLGDADYPALLAETEAAPSVLIVKGRGDLSARPCVAIVGARNASAAACRFARDLAFSLSGRGMVVVSGLARGIDTSAHQGAIAGGTIAVIASGIDIAYPPENQKLQTDIAERGLLVSEHPPGREPLARHFPSRNRIIAGLSLGTIVVEAAPKSGSLITARLATEMGREVMAVPGSPLDARAQGCNALIRDGATLIQSADDVVEALGPIMPGLRQDRLPYLASPDLDEEANDTIRQRVLDLLSPTSVAVDELVRQSETSAGQVQLVLLELELAGKICRHAGGRVSLS